jgi:hypothetical protein
MSPAVHMVLVLVAALSDEALVGYSVGIVAAITARGLAKKADDALANPADQIRFEGRREES